MGGGGLIDLPARLDTVGSLAPLGYPDRLPAALTLFRCFKAWGMNHILFPKGWGMQQSLSLQHAKST